MHGKRVRSAWAALDDAHAELFSPSRTTVTASDSAIFVTSETPDANSNRTPSPAEQFAEARLMRETVAANSPQKTSSSTPCYTQQTPQSRVKARTHQRCEDDRQNDPEDEVSPTTSTPLVVSRQDILSARRQLKLSPSTPSSQRTVFLDPQAAKEARALLSSAKRRRSQVTPLSDFDARYSSPRPEFCNASGENPDFDNPQHSLSPPFDHPKCLDDSVDGALRFETNPDSQPVIIPTSHRPLTPAANRRASTGSAVTPLPLRFESPQRPIDLDDLAPPSSHPPPPPPLPPLPSELHHNMSSPITPAVRPASKKCSAALSSPSENDKPFGFTTAAGRPLRPAAVPAALADLFDTDADSTLQPLACPASKSDLCPQKKRLKPNCQLDLAEPVPLELQPPDVAKDDSAGLKDANNCIDISPPDSGHEKAVASTPAIDDGNLGGALFTSGAGKPIDLPLFAMDAGAPIDASLFTTGAGKPINTPVPQTRASKILDTPLLTSGGGKPVDVPARDAPEILDVPLFKTGGGKPVSVSARDASKILDAPLFTTGGGKPVDILTRSAVGKRTLDASLFTTGTDKAIDVPLFTTGGGKPLDNPTCAVTNAGSDMNTPILKEAWEPRVSFTLDAQHSDLSKLSVRSNGSSTFRTPSPAIRLGFSAAQAGAALPKGLTMLGHGLASTEQRRAFRGLVTPSGKTPPTDDLRKMLFNDSARGGSSGKRGRGRGRAGGIAYGVKTTPFKSPRIIRRRKASIKPVEKNVLRLTVPCLKKSGGFVCVSNKCTCVKKSCSFLENVEDSLFGDFNVLKESQAFEFSQNQRGNVQCLPNEVKGSKTLWGTTSFGVANCIRWVHELFGSKQEKGAATCVGSDAWTRMSYALAVSKLWRLSLETGLGSLYFSAAGVVRELLRRIEKEWHCSKQPWLLRIMRGDTNAGCHFVGRLVEFEVFSDGEIMFVITDGWYVARAKVDAELKKMISKGWLRAGEKVHLIGASLQTGENTRMKEWAFGAGDELSNGFLRLHKNSLFKVPENRQPKLKLGIQPMVFVKNLKCVTEDGGIVSGITVVVLRSYAICYMENKVKMVTGPDGEEDEQTVHIWRREEAEEAARVEYESEVMKNRLARKEHRRQQRRTSENVNFGDEENDEHVNDLAEVPPRQVTPVQELLICGVGDNSRVKENRKFLRIYNCSEDMDRLLRRTGAVLHVRNVVPKKRGVWTCRPDGVCEARSSVAISPNITLDRVVATVEDLKNGVVDRGDDFDGVFYVVYRAITSNNFVYLSDDTGDAVSLVALQVCSSDAEFMPKALLPTNGKDPEADETFPIVVLTDATFESELADLEVVHARTTLRTAILAPKKSNSSSKRKSNLSRLLEERVEQLERRLKVGETRTQLQILREAVASFCSGQRASVAAYFSSTQEV